MTKDQLELLIEFINSTIDAAVNDPYGEAGLRYQAEKRLRSEFACVPVSEKAYACPVHGRRLPAILHITPTDARL